VHVVVFTRNSRFKVLDNGRLRLPKIGDLEVRWSRDLPADPSSVTIIRDAAGRYFALFVVQTADQPLPEVLQGGEDVNRQGSHRCFPAEAVDPAATA
jgi:transposase